MVAGGWEGLDFVRSLAQEKIPPTFLLSRGDGCMDSGAVYTSLSTMEDLPGVSGSEWRVDSLGSERAEFACRSWYMAKIEDFGGGGGRS
jgi:hypothetical protein